MRTTVTLAPDVAAAVAQLRALRGIGTSEALNEIARRGLTAPAERRPFRHDRIRPWLTERLNGPPRTGLPWQSLTAFLRISTHPRASARPLDAAEAWQQVFGDDVTWIDPTRGPRG
jgi:hypothetical protein